MPGIKTSKPVYLSDGGDSDRPSTPQDPDKHAGMRPRDAHTSEGGGVGFLVFQQDWTSQNMNTC